MKQTYVKYLMVAVLTAGFLFTSCRTARETTAQYEVTKVEGSMITIDSVWDTTPNVKATEILKPYKEKVDAMMYEVIGTSAMKMEKELLKFAFRPCCRCFTASSGSGVGETCRYGTGKHGRACAISCPKGISR